MRERPKLIVRPTECTWLEKPLEETKVEEPVEEPLEELPEGLAEELQKELDDIKTPPAKYRIELRISDNLGQQSNLQSILQKHIDAELIKFFSASSDIIINMPNGDSFLLKNTEAKVSSDDDGNRTAEYNPKKENVVISNYGWKRVGVITSHGVPAHLLQQEYTDLKKLSEEYSDWDQLKAQREREAERLKLIKSGLVTEQDFEKI